MSNEITAYFKGRIGVAESIYQYDYGRTLVIDGLTLPSVFEAHFAMPGDEEAIIVTGQDNRVAIPNACLSQTGVVTMYIYEHSGLNDGETEYIVRFNVIRRAKPVDDGTEKEKSFMSDAIALMQHVSIQGEVDNWLDEHPEATTTVEDGAITEPKLHNSLKRVLKNKVTFAHASFLYEYPSECVDPELGFGLCGVFWDNETCIVNDFGAGSDGSTLVNFLASKEISKVDAVIVSHYHGDHINTTSLNALLNSDIDLSECTFYLPHKGINWAAFIGTSGVSPSSIESSVKSALTTSGITYVEPDEEGYLVEIGDFTLEFYNVDSSYYSDYYPYKYYSKGSYETDSTRYNNFSMCTNLNIDGTNIFLTGDIEYPAQEKMAKYVARADVYLVPHHGRNLKESQDLINNLSCSIGVIPQYCDINGSSTEGLLSPSAGRCRELGTLVSTLNNDVNIVIDGGRVYTDSTNDSQNGQCIGHVILQGTDFDDLGYGDYFCGSPSDIETFTHDPASAIGVTRTFTMHVEPLNMYSVEDNRIIQTAYIRGDNESDTSGIIMQRLKIETWGDWRPINLPLKKSAYNDGAFNTAYGKLSPASLRGYMTSAEVNNLNNAYLSGFYAVALSASNLPSGVNSAGYLLVMSFKNASNLHRCMQIYVPFDYDTVRIRRCVDDPAIASNWTSWKTITPA